MGASRFLKSTVVQLLNGGCTTAKCKQAFPSSEDGAEYALGTLYPEMLPNNYERYSEFRVDRANGMATFKWANEYGKSGAPAYRYVFRQSAEGSPGLGQFGCGHLVENLYVFSDPEIIGPGHTMTAGELATADLATQLWTDFAKALKFAPGVWPEYSAPTGDVSATSLEIGPDGRTRVEEKWREAQYNFFSLWEGYDQATAGTNASAEQ